MKMAKLLLLLSIITSLCTSIPMNEAPAVELKKVPSTGSSLRRRQNADLNFETYDYVTTVAVGGQDFWLLVDTGSSDTWIVDSNLACALGPGKCNYGSAYQLPGSFQKVEGVYLNVHYVDGSGAGGDAGCDTVTVAGLTVANQIVGMANYVGTRNADGVSSGILGLGFPNLTNVYSISTDDPWAYSPIVTSMFDAGLTATKEFSFALSTDGGILAFGGYPEGVTFQLPWAQAPMIPAGDTYSRYTIPVKLDFTNSDQFGTTNIIVDSGSTVSELPSDIAAAVNALFQPPGILGSSGEYTVDCDATPPDFSVVIGGVSLAVSAEDMIYRGGSSSICISSIIGVDGDLFALGDSFLRNVVVVVDYEYELLWFAAVST
jgi:hypothetical protein